MKRQVKTISFFYREDNSRAKMWEKKIKAWLARNHPQIKVVSRHADVLVVLGGDGTILEATRKNNRRTPIILGLNLGQVGFLASAREPSKFIPALSKLLKGLYQVTKRLMIEVDVIRSNKNVFTANAFNEIVIGNPLGMVEIEVSIEGDPIQYIRGTGVMIATASGSTAYNLSAHGPIIMPDIKCFIITELLDHNIPTPSIVVRRNKEVGLKVVDFRERGVLSMSKTGESVDVLLISDGDKVFPLKKNDRVLVRKSSRLVKFAELEKNYFFKSLQEKFSFK